MVLVSLAALWCSGCVFPELIDVSVSGGGGEPYVLSFSFNTEVELCVENAQPGDFTCLYAGDAGSSIDSHVIITGSDILFLLILDPMVLELPAEATALAGSCFHSSSGDGGPLAITGGLSSLPVDENRSLTAEPGTQLVVIELPPGAPTSGNFSFNLNFQMPPNATGVPWKALFTAKVETAAQTYYAPLLPCVDDLANAPELFVPLPGGGQIPFPLGQVAGCSGEVYQYGVQAAAEIPIAGLLGRIALALLLVGAGWLVMRRR